MTPDRWLRLADLVPDALAVEPADRDAFLDRACVDADGALDPTLRDEVGRLAAAAEAADRAGSLTSPVAPSFATDVLPDRIGAWRVTGLLGEGGAGVVYLAERADDRVQRTVALKVLRRAGRGVARQFDRERRALARLEHPHIARLYDAGVVGDGPLAGTPFLEMEWVNGLPLPAAADRLGLGVEARVRLLLQVCAAVSYAHGRLVLHRDLKPSNVVVTEDTEGPRAVVLDFGVARLLGDAADPALTRTGESLYTPAYAAPEQVAGDDVTTATDVYGVGALLYEVLTGVRPRTSAETGRLPPVPSRVAGDHARRIEGDLDTICLKALAPAPERRYLSVDALAADLTRHLEGLPVEARPTTLGYRVGRFVHRHRTGVVATALVALAVVGGLGASLWQRAEAHRERDRAQVAAVEAQAQADRAEAVAGFLEQILRAPNQRWYNDGVATGPETPIRAVLDEAATRVDRDFADQPDLLADLHHVLGDTYGALGLVDEAVRHHDRTLALRESIYVAPHPKIAEALYYSAASDRDDMNRSTQTMQRALDMLRQRNEGNNFPFIARDLAGRYLMLGLPHRAEAVAAEGARVAEARFVPGDDGFRYRETILFLLATTQAAALLDLDRLPEAAPLLHRADSLWARLPSSSGQYVNWQFYVCQVGRLRRRQNRHDEAEAALLACIGDPSPRAARPPMPAPPVRMPYDAWTDQGEALELVALYDGLGRPAEADRFRARARQSQALFDSFRTAGRALDRAR